MNIEIIKEPTLEFGEEFLYDDPKAGVMHGGFFSSTNKGHKSEIHFGIIGTNNNIENLLKWVATFDDIVMASETVNKTKSSSKISDDGGVEEEIEDDDEELLLFSYDSEEVLEDEEVLTKINKRLNPDFPGFKKDSCFNCSFVNDSSNNKRIYESQLKEILGNTPSVSSIETAKSFCNLYVEQYIAMLDGISKPNVCFVVIPSGLFELFSSISMGHGQFFNLRRFLKAKMIEQRNSIPVQIILQETIEGKKKRLQDLSMQAWNFVVTNYYKNGSIPWTLSVQDKHTCFIGISFHKMNGSKDNLIRSSVAQAFNYEGKGIIFIGNQFLWDKEEAKTPAPHLTHGYSKDLIQKVIAEYKKYNDDLPPKRVVVHKTTDFWDSTFSKGKYAEVEGIKDGIRAELGNKVEIDLVTIKSSPIKAFRQTGIYPIPRGTLIKLDKATGILYTTGYIAYYETFPGSHVPHPIEVSIYEGESTLRKVAEEILALTKLNFNNCNYFDSLPITVRFAQKVGEIVQYIEKPENAPNKYYFYM